MTCSRTARSRDVTRPHAGIEDPLVEVLRARLERMVLHELQTNGGLSIQQLGCPCDSSTAAARCAAEIRALVDRLRQLREGMVARTGSIIVERFKPNRLLDLGAGLAPWSIAVAACSREIVITALDLPGQVPDLRHAVGLSCLGDCFTLIAADAVTFDFATLPPQDVVLIANVCHVFDGTRTRSLLGRAALAIRPGGTIAVIDQVLDDTPDWGRWATLYAVGAPHWLPGGYLHTPEEYRYWLSDAGVRDITFQSISPPPAMTLITATR